MKDLYRLKGTGSCRQRSQPVGYFEVPFLQGTAGASPAADPMSTDQVIPDWFKNPFLGELNLGLMTWGLA